jgi:hypothetical protein
MGHQTFVYGYIETDPSMDDFNMRVLDTYRFDDIYPFTNIFSPPRGGYQASMISFAGAYKTLEEDWPQWQSQFEALLGKLVAFSAQVHLENELDGQLFKLSYVCKDRLSSEPQNRKKVWLYWKTVCNNAVSEETELTL